MSSGLELSEKQGWAFLYRDVIVPAFPGTLLLSQWIATKAIPGKTGTNHIPAFVRCIQHNNALSAHESVSL